VPGAASTRANPGLMQWRSQLKMLYFRRETAFLFWTPLSKHKITRYAKKLRGVVPLDTPMASCRVRNTVCSQNSWQQVLKIISLKATSGKFIPHESNISIFLKNILKFNGPAQRRNLLETGWTTYSII